MRLLISFILSFIVTLSVYAQSVLSFGLRGGMDFLMPKSEYNARVQIGGVGGGDFGYTYYWPTKNVDCGIHTGLSVGFAQSNTNIEISQQYVNYDYLGNEIQYTTSAVYDAALQRVCLDIPVMVAFRSKGFVTQFGIKGQFAVWSQTKQNLQDPLIEAFYVQYGVPVMDELITGLVSPEKLSKNYAGGAPLFSILASAKIGYEFKISQSGVIGLALFVDCTAWNTNIPNNSITLIDVAPISDPIYPVPNVTINNVISAVQRTNPLQFGISVYYGLDLRKR